MSNKLKSVQLNKVIVSLRTERPLVMMFTTLKKKRRLAVSCVTTERISLSCCFTSIHLNTILYWTLIVIISGFPLTVRSQVFDVTFFFLVLFCDEESGSERQPTRQVD